MVNRREGRNKITIKIKYFQIDSGIRRRTVEQMMSFFFQDSSSTPSDSACEEQDDGITPDEVDEQEKSVEQVDLSLCPSDRPAEKKAHEFSEDSPKQREYHCDKEILKPTVFARCYQSSKQRKSENYLAKYIENRRCSYLTLLLGDRQNL